MSMHAICANGTSWELWRTRRSPRVALTKSADAAARRVLLIGPPGSCKGTVGPFLATHLGVPHLSSGQLLRGSLRAGDPYGIAALVASGKFVPDDVVARVVDEHLGSGFVMSGGDREDLHRLRRRSDLRPFREVGEADDPGRAAAKGCCSNRSDHEPARLVG